VKFSHLNKFNGYRRSKRLLSSKVHMRKYSVS